MSVIAPTDIKASVCIILLPKKIDTLVSIEDGYAGGLMLHDNDILEYRCGSEMTLDTLCLYDIKKNKNIQFVPMSLMKMTLLIP